MKAKLLPVIILMICSLSINAQDNGNARILCNTCASCCAGTTHCPQVATFTTDAPNNPVTFTITSTPCTNVMWDFGDGNGTSTDINPTYTYADAGPFTVSLFCSCSDGTDPCCTAHQNAVISITPTGISNHSFNSAMTLSPNPAEDKLIVSGYKMTGKGFVIISNILGEVLKRENVIMSKQLTLDIKDIPPGIYFVQISNESEKRVNRFVKK